MSERRLNTSQILRLVRGCELIASVTNEPIATLLAGALGIEEEEEDLEPDVDVEPAGAVVPERRRRTNAVAGVTAE